MAVATGVHADVCTASCGPTPRSAGSGPVTPVRNAAREIIRWLESPRISALETRRGTVPPIGENGSRGRLAGGIAHDFNNCSR